MKITEEIKDELFIEFCDMDANNELCLYKDSFKEAITKALTLYGVVTSKKVSDIVCKALYDQYDFEIRRYPDDSVSSINENEVIKFVKKELG